MRIRPEEEITDLGRVLRALREKDRISVAEQAEKYGLTTGFISRNSNGTALFSSSTVVKIIEMYSDDEDVQKDLAIAWVKQYQTLRNLPLPKTTREALMAASFLLGVDFEQEKEKSVV